MDSDFLIEKSFFFVLLWWAKWDERVRVCAKFDVKYVPSCSMVPAIIVDKSVTQPRVDNDWVLKSPVNDKRWCLKLKNARYEIGCELWRLFGCVEELNIRMWFQVMVRWRWNSFGCIYDIAACTLRMNACLYAKLDNLLKMRIKTM